MFKFLEKRQTKVFADWICNNNFVEMFGVIGFWYAYVQLRKSKCSLRGSL